tara:strand:+ start:10332 stop:11498 length:1167 start_codon:yes stop_codon:yes gene_type:complete
MKVIIRAPLLSVSGYGVHSRQIFTYLENAKIFEINAQVVHWGTTPWLIDPDLENGQIGRIMSKTQEFSEPADLSLQVQLPDEWDSNLARVNIGVSAVVETDRCNIKWVDACNNMDAVIVPSQHAKDCLERSGNLSTRVFVIPEWFFPEVETEDFDENKFSNMKFDTDFNFLILSQLTGQSSATDRKNILSTIKWICETFKDDKDVGIVIKTNHGRGTTIDREITEGLIRHVISEVRDGPYPKITLVHGNLYPAEIAGLYRNDSIKALVSLTRGEGFGLPLLEAAASGLPVISTNWSAHTEFLSLGRFIGINYDLVNIPSEKVDDRIFVDGIRWADPHEDDFKNKILKFKNKSDLPRKWAQDLSVKIRDQYSSRSIQQSYHDVLREILE